MKTVLSIDPSGDPRGETGIVLLGYDDDTPAHVLGSWAIPGGIGGFRDWHRNQFPQWTHFPTICVYPGDFFVNTVVCEQFVDRQIMGAERSALLVEGVVRWLWPNVVLSPASGYKQAVSDDVLKRLDLWWTGDHHADRNSAARHGVRYIKNQQHVPTLKKGWSKP